MSKVTCFLPCRQGSQRVPNKNIKKFSTFEFGLIQIKLKQLQESKYIDEIVLTTNDVNILDYAKSLPLNKLRLHRRDDSLASSETSTDQLVAHALELITDGDILWTHVTSPFITSQCYDSIIKTYQAKKQEGFDSLMTVSDIQGFLWRNGVPINYDRKVEKWPRTQTLEPVSEINSGVFLASHNMYAKFNDRIGQTPYLYPLNKLVGFDIDWPEDFVIAECMIEKGLVDI